MAKSGLLQPYLPQVDQIWGICHYVQLSILKIFTFCNTFHTYEINLTLTKSFQRNDKMRWLYGTVSKVRAYLKYRDRIGAVE